MKSWTIYRLLHYEAYRIRDKKGTWNLWGHSISTAATVSTEQLFCLWEEEVHFLLIPLGTTDSLFVSIDLKGQKPEGEGRRGIRQGSCLPLT